MVNHMDTHQIAANDAAVHSTNDIVVRALKVSDLIDCLKLGLEDFKAKPSHIFVLGLIYPIGTALAFGYALGRDVLPLAFPVAAGLALLGPFAAIVLYEISRRREQGQSFAWGDIGEVFHRVSTWSVGVLMVALVAVFGVWLVVAQAIFDATLGVGGYIAPAAFIGQVLTTPEGWTLIMLGNAAGLVFAAGVLATNVVSFPMLLDREVGASAAVATSLRVAAKSPVTVAIWGLIIAGSMAIGAAALLVGLGVVVPVLGHATWHLYRKAVPQ